MSHPIKYKWSKGSVFPVEPTVAREAIVEIEHRHGIASPSIIVEEARNTSHPLHNCFEWDDRIAANNYRLNQATSILVNLIEIDEREPRKKNKVEDIEIIEQTNVAPPFKKISIKIKDNKEILEDLRQEWEDSKERLLQFSSDLKKMDAKVGAAFEQEMKGFLKWYSDKDEDVIGGIIKDAGIQHDCQVAKDFIYIMSGEAC